MFVSLHMRIHNFVPFCIVCVFLYLDVSCLTRSGGQGEEY